jgi:competence protein ComEA
MAGDSRGTVIVWVVAAALGVFALMRLTGSGGDAETGEPVRVDRSPGASAAEPPGGAESAGLYVHVAGAVQRPGLVRVPAGARVAEAVLRAGGPGRKADLSGINLAAQVEDGQQVVVPSAGAVPPAADGPAATPGSAAVKPSLGSATVEQLDEIDGIGPTLAERIVEYRTENGGFSSLDQLDEVDGIGEARLKTLRETLQP